MRHHRWSAWRSTALAVIAVSALTNGARGYAAQEAADRRLPMVAGELILRMKPDFSACAHCLLADEGFTATTGRRILDQVRLRYRIRAMEPLYGGVHGEAQRKAARRRFGKHDREKTGADLGSAALPDLNQTYRVRVDPQTDLSRLASDLQRDPAVEWVEPNYLYRATAAPGLPDDPFLRSSGSWGQSFPHVWGLFQIEAVAAWQIAQGEGVIVAVVDSGLDIDHPDIADNPWVNEGEIPDNGIDDDGNGFADDTYGWDFTRCRRLSPNGSCSEPKEPGPELTDENGHATHIAGTISAVGDNGIGIIGVAPQARVMALRRNGGGLHGEWLFRKVCALSGRNGTAAGAVPMSVCHQFLRRAPRGVRARALGGGRGLRARLGHQLCAATREWRGGAGTERSPGIHPATGTTGTAQYG